MNAVPVERPIELSFSRLQTYLRCPWMYHLVYNQGWRSGPTGSSALGQSLHRALAAYLSPDNTERTLDRLMELYDGAWVNEGFSSTQQTLDVYDQGRKMLERFHATDQTRQSEVLATETEFSIPLGGNVRFRGTVDRLDRHPDGSLEIVEYKTQGEHWTPSRMESDLQMTLYAIGIGAAHGHAPVRLTYHFLSTNQRITVARTPEQIKSAETLLSEVAEKIGRKALEPNHAHCVRCEFLNRCAKARRSEERPA